MAGSSVASAAELLRHSGHEGPAASSCSAWPLSKASTASAGCAEGATALLVSSRAESQALSSEKPEGDAEGELEAVEAPEDDRGERSRLWKASEAAESPAEGPEAGRLPPHCSHALLMLGWDSTRMWCFCFFDQFSITNLAFPAVARVFYMEGLGME